MARVLTYGDQHVRMTGSFLPFNITSTNGLTKELNNILGGFTFISELVREYKPDIVVNLGDIYHNYDIIPLAAVHTAGIGIRMITDACKDVGSHHYIIMGNHDLSSMDPIVTSLTPFQNETCTVITDVWSHSIGGKGITFIPYCSDEYLYQHYLNYKDQDIIFTHNEVKGAYYESGKMSECRVESPSHPIIVAGHIHLHQIIGNVYLPGSLVQNRFNRKKIDTVGICMIDTETMVVTGIMNSRSRHYIVCSSTDEALKLNKSSVVIKLFSNEDREEVERKLDGYLYTQTKPPRQRDEERTIVYESMHAHDPDTLLRSYVSQNNPDASEMLEQIVGGKTNGV